jgi:hypothetical protein
VLLHPTAYWTNPCVRSDLTKKVQHTNFVSEYRLEDWEEYTSNDKPYPRGELVVKKADIVRRTKMYWNFLRINCNVYFRSLEVTLVIKNERKCFVSCFD